MVSLVSLVCLVCSVCCRLAPGFRIQNSKFKIAAARGVDGSGVYLTARSFHSLDIRDKNLFRRATPPGGNMSAGRKELRKPEVRYRTLTIFDVTAYFPVKPDARMPPGSIARGHSLVHPGNLANLQDARAVKKNPSTVHRTSRIPQDFSRSNPLYLGCF